MTIGLGIWCVSFTIVIFIVDLRHGRRERAIKASNEANMKSNRETAAIYRDTIVELQKNSDLMLAVLRVQRSPSGFVSKGGDA